MVIRSLLSVLTALVIWVGLGSGFLVAAPAAIALTTADADLERGAHLFEVHCVGCHPQGGNIIRRGKTLQMKALERNHMDSVEAIAQIVTQGKRPMSAYEGTLTPEEIWDVSAYTWTQAEAGWK